MGKSATEAHLVHGDAGCMRDALPQLMHSEGLLHRSHVLFHSFVNEVYLGEDAYTTQPLLHELPIQVLEHLQHVCH